jgi:hypothetical protein
VVQVERLLLVGVGVRKLLLLERDIRPLRVQKREWLVYGRVRVLPMQRLGQQRLRLLVVVLLNLMVVH